MLTNFGIKLYSKSVQIWNHTKNQRGAQAIEYIGVAALAVVLILAMIKLFGSDGDGIAKKLVDKLKDFIDKISL